MVKPGRMDGGREGWCSGPWTPIAGVEGEREGGERESACRTCPHGEGDWLGCNCKREEGTGWVKDIAGCAGAIQDGFDFLQRNFQGIEDLHWRARVRIENLEAILESRVPRKHQ